MLYSCKIGTVKNKCIFIDNLRININTEHNYDRWDLNVFQDEVKRKGNGEKLNNNWLQRTDTFELWCWRRLLRVPWMTKRTNQSILKEINPEYSLEGLMLKLKLQYFGHLMQRVNSLEKTLMPEKIEGRRRGTTEDEMVGWHHRLDGHEFEQALGDSEGQGRLACFSPWVH